MLPEEKLFADIKNLVISARQRAFKAVDSERVILYWQIGNRINEEILQNQRAEFGKQVVKNLSKKMTLEFGSGFNQINLWLFIRFVTFFPDFEIVYALRKLFSWTHFRIFIRIEDDLKRRFYMEMCRIEGWGTQRLGQIGRTHRITNARSGRYSRGAIPDRTASARGFAGETSCSNR